MPTKLQQIYDFSSGTSTLSAVNLIIIINMKIKRDKRLIKPSKFKFTQKTDQPIPNQHVQKLSLSRKGINKEFLIQRHSLKCVNPKIRAQYHSKLPNHSETMLSQKDHYEKSLQREKKSLKHMSPSRQSKQFMKVFKRKKNEKPRQSLECESQKSTRMRYSKFEFRSEKYIRLSTQPGTLQQNSDEQKQRQKEKQKEKEKQVKQLLNELKYYQGLYQNTLQKIQESKKARQIEKKKYFCKRKNFKEEIKKLKTHIDQQKINLGHIYSYKEFEHEALMPNTLILQSSFESHNQDDLQALSINRKIRI